MPPGTGPVPCVPEAADAWLAPRRFALGLALLLLAVFHGVIFGAQTFFFRDFGTLAYPFVHFHRESLWRGELPLWNPLSNCGVPFLAQWNTLVLYPPSLIYLVLPLPWSLNVFCVAHLFLAGLGTYLLARDWTGNPFAGAVAGLAFVLGGATLSSHVYPNYLVALGWMPFVAWLAERGCRTGGRWWLMAVLVGALQMLSGAPEIVLQTWVLAGVLVLVQAWECPRLEAPARPARAWILLRLPGLVLAVAALTAIQLLPFLDLLAQSQRGSGFAGQFWSMPGYGWANLLLPLFHCFPTPQGVFFQAGQSFLVSYYGGAGVLALAVVGLWQVRQRRVWALGVLALLSLVLALGDHGLLHAWLRAAAPWVAVARFPIKFVYLAAFLLPLLAAFGVAALGPARAAAPAAPDASALPSPALRPLAVTGAVLLLLLGALLWFVHRYPYPGDNWAATWRNGAGRALFLVALLGLLGARALWFAPTRWVLCVAALAVLAGDLLTQTPHLTPLLPSAALAPGVAELKPVPRVGAARVMPTPRAEVLLTTRTLPDFRQDFLGSRLALWSNLNVLEAIPKVNGAATLQLRAQAALEAVLYASFTNTYPGLMDFLGVSHLSSPANPIEWVACAGFLPWVTAGQEPVFADDNAAFQAVTGPHFEPRARVYLPPQARSGVAARRSPQARISGLEFRQNHVAFATHAPEAALVVIAQSFHRGWRASVDGQAVPLWRANYAFKTLEVPPGDHQVRLAYVEPRLQIGAMISGVTLLAGIVWWRRLGRTT